MTNIWGKNSNYSVSNSTGPNNPLAYYGICYHLMFSLFHVGMWCESYRIRWRKPVLPSQRTHPLSRLPQTVVGKWAEPRRLLTRDLLGTDKRIHVLTFLSYRRTLFVHSFTPIHPLARDNLQYFFGHT